MAQDVVVSDAPPNDRRRNMQANRRRDTKPERALRSLLFAAGYRYRCDLRIPLEGTFARPDIVFTRQKIAIFVDGCFWHSCPTHGSVPRRNGDYWRPKLERNRVRDAAQSRALQAAGWRVIRIWEHVPPDVALRTVVSAVRIRAEAGAPHIVGGAGQTRLAHNVGQSGGACSD